MSVQYSYGQDFFIKKDTAFTFIQPFAAGQLWGAYSINEKRNLNPMPGLEEVDNRFNPYFRRARIGFRGSPYRRFKYYIAISFDNLGKDELSAPRGDENEADIIIWDAYVQWRSSLNHDLLNVTAGYFRPQMSRESITSAFSVNSLIKATAQSYIRDHLVEQGNGRAIGLNLGGLFGAEHFSFNYNMGIFDNQVRKVTKWNPLWVGRLAFTFGDPEMKTYGIGYKVNYFNQRNGVTLAISSSLQNATDQFAQSTATGFDLLLNYGPVNFTAEWNFMERESNSGNVFNSNTGFIRGGYNFIVYDRFFLEPVIMYSRFEGDSGASIVDTHEGEDEVIDFGMNWYVNKNLLKVNLHYVIQMGNGNNLLTDENTFEKGDFLGLGLQFII